MVTLLGVSPCEALSRATRSRTLESMSRGPVVLIPGGLYEDMDVGRFWIEPGVVEDLDVAGFDALPVQRLRRPTSWSEDAAAVTAHIRDLGSDVVAVVAGSNGCSTALRLAIASPELVSRIVLCWPATAHDGAVDEKARERIEQATGPATADRLLAGDTLRGVADTELRALTIPVTLVPSEPETVFHRRETVIALARLLPDVSVAAGSPESPSPEFAARRATFLQSLSKALSPP